MNIFITGATGYIGQELLKKLLEKGHHVHALVRNKTGRLLHEHPNLEWHEGDLLNLSDIHMAMQNCEQVYHTAGYARVYAKNPSVYYEQNVSATENVLKAARQLNVQKVVFTSSAAVIGPTACEIADEKSQRRMNFLNEYEVSKFMAEQAVMRFVKNGLNVVIVNPSRVYGPGKISRSNPLLLLIRFMLKSRVAFIPGKGDGIGSYSFIDDVIQGHLLAMKHGRSGERYLLGGENVSCEHLFKTIVKASNKNIRIMHLPITMIRALSSVELVRAKLSSYDPWVVPAWIGKYTLNAAYSSEKATRELNYSITPLMKGIEKTIEFINA